MVQLPACSIVTVLPATEQEPGVVLAALILPFTALGHYFGFQAPPAEFLAILAALVVAYLAIVEAAKRMFYRHLGTKPN